jgi:hypothetical protein
MFSSKVFNVWAILNFDLFVFGLFVVDIISILTALQERQIKKDAAFGK